MSNTDEQRRKPSDLERTEELFQFLQGNTPDGYKINKKGIPKLTPEQARTVIWYLGNQYWKVTDHIYPCDVCGDFYDGDSEGDCLDFGNYLYFFCGGCTETERYRRKLYSRLNPDRPKKGK